MASNLAVTPDTGYDMTVIEGPHKGLVFKIMSLPVRIGRSQDNEIALPQDPKVSRKHATIEYDKESIVIKDVSGRQRLSVDGRSTQKTTLGNGSVIDLGDSKIIFKVDLPQAMAAPGLPQQPALTPVQHDSDIDFQTFAQIDLASPKAAPAQASPFQQAYQPQMPPRQSHSGGMDPGRKRFYMIVGSIFAVIIGLAVMKKPVKTTDKFDITTEEEINSKIELIEKEREAYEEEIRKRRVRPSAYRDAQAAYIRGFRDFQAGNFERAMDQFQACLSTLPEHVLCRRYYALSQRKFNELIQYHMVLGRQYMEQNQFDSCKSAFRNVLVLIKDRSQTLYQEAEANFKYCQSLSREQF